MTSNAHQVHTKVLHETKGPRDRLGGRLGRHVEHDSRSRDFAITPHKEPLVSKWWRRHCPAFDQGNLGSCTGNALAGLLMTEPFYKPGRELTEDDAVKLYERGTHLDKIPGHYPPDDTGSSGLAVMKAAKELGYLSGYKHAFGLSAALSALQHGPFILGIDWYEGFDSPQGEAGELVISGEVRGGHEVEILAIDVEHQRVGGINSWGESYAHLGYFSMSFATLGKLLASRGDVTLGVL